MEGRKEAAANDVSPDMSAWNWLLMLGVSTIWLGMAGAFAYLASHKVPTRR